MSTNLCGTIGGNVGPILCDKTPGVPKKLLFGGKQFGSSDYGDSDSFRTAVLAACKLPMGNGTKLFPTPEVQGVENKTEANKEGTLAFGLKMVLMEGLPSYEFSFLMATTQYQKWRAFNGTTIPVFVADNQNLVWGKKSGANFVGFDAYVFFTGNTFGNGTDIVVVKGTVSLTSASDYHDFAAYVPFNFNINEAKGLNDVVFSEPVAHTTNVYKIKAEILTAQMGKKINMYDTYPSALASSSLYTAFTGADFATSLAITSVAADATNKGYTVTLDSTAFGLLAAGDKIKFNYAVPATLDAANVVDVEGVPIILVK